MRKNNIKEEKRERKRIQEEKRVEKKKERKGKSGEMRRKGKKS